MVYLEVLLENTVIYMWTLVSNLVKKPNSTVYNPLELIVETELVHFGKYLHIIGKYLIDKYVDIDLKLKVLN